MGLRCMGSLGEANQLNKCHEKKKITGRLCRQLVVPVHSSFKTPAIIYVYTEADFKSLSFHNHYIS